MVRKATLSKICEQFSIDILYAFGSRAQELVRFTQEQLDSLQTSGSDADLGFKASTHLTMRQKAELTLSLEEFFSIETVDLVDIPQAAPHIAKEIVCGELLYAKSSHQEAEYQLYIMRRAADLQYLYRQKEALALGKPFE